MLGKARDASIAVSVMALAWAMPAATQTKAGQDAPARTASNTAPPAAETRASALADKMTPAEKLRYVHGYFPPMSKDKPADMIPSAGYVPGVPRLGIPTLRESDASLGVANQIEQRKGVAINNPTLFVDGRTVAVK